MPSLPKLDYRSQELRRRIYGSGSSVVARWLEPPYSLDGWRIDVANMTGRLHDVDLIAEVATACARPPSPRGRTRVVVAEHAHDARADLRPAAWHGTMAYAGFTRPVWTWLRGDELPGELAAEFLGLPVGVPRLSGQAVVETMRRFRAGVPWPSVLHSWAILDSHDTARFRTVAGSRERQLVGVGLQMTTPGVPMVFAGDEIGLEGEWGEDARRTMPWSRPETWDTELLDALPRARRPTPQQPRARARRHPLRRTSPTTRSRTCASRRARRCSASPRARRTSPFGSPLAALGGSELETLLRRRRERREAARQSYPATGPAFHAWRVA